MCIMMTDASEHPALDTSLFYYMMCQLLPLSCFLFNVEVKREWRRSGKNGNNGKKYTYGISLCLKSALKSFLPTLHSSIYDGCQSLGTHSNDTLINRETNKAHNKSACVRRINPQILAVSSNLPRSDSGSSLHPLGAVCRSADLPQMTPVPLTRWTQC